MRGEYYDSCHHTATIHHQMHVCGDQSSVNGELVDVRMQGDEYIWHCVDGSNQIPPAELSSKAQGGWSLRGGS